MLFLYRVLINFVILISPIIIIFRLIQNKESLTRFKEKFCFFSKKRSSGKLIWFHGASVGELQSIIPLLEKKQNFSLNLVKLSFFLINLKIIIIGNHRMFFL